MCNHCGDYNHSRNDSGDEEPIELDRLERFPGEPIVHKGRISTFIRHPVIQKYAVRGTTYKAAATSWNRLAALVNAGRR